MASLKQRIEALERSLRLKDDPVRISVRHWSEPFVVDGEEVSMEEYRRRTGEFVFTLNIGEATIDELRTA